MSNPMIDLAAKTVITAKSAGGDHCRVRISADRTVEISSREGKPETIREAATKNLSLEIYAKGRYSSQTTSDLREAALGTFAANAVAATKLLAEDPSRTFPDPKYINLLLPSQRFIHPQARNRCSPSRNDNLPGCGSMSRTTK